MHSCFFLASISNTLISAIPVLGALVLGAQRLLPVLQQAYSGITNFRGARVSLDDSLELLDQQLPDFLFQEINEKMYFEKFVKLKNISFRFNLNSQFIFQNASLEIKKGSRIGVFGSTGSGKSTLADIIMGLLEPNKVKFLLTMLSFQMQLDTMAIYYCSCPNLYFLLILQFWRILRSVSFKLNRFQKLKMLQG